MSDEEKEEMAYLERLACALFVGCQKLVLGTALSTLVCEWVWNVAKRGG